MLATVVGSVVGSVAGQPATSSCADKELGFNPGTLRKFGIPSGLETCTNVIPILAMADTAANFTMYQVCTWSMPALAMALASKGLPWRPPSGPEYVYEVCEQYCNSMASVETPCSGGRLRLEETPIKSFGFKQLLSDGQTKSCDTCSHGGEIIPPGAPVACDSAHYEPDDYAIQKDFKRGVRNKYDCAQRCIDTKGCTGIQTTGTPNFCALWFNNACSSLDSAGVMSNGYYHNWYLPAAAQELAVQPVNIHGDPVLKINGKGKRFDLPVGGPMTLLKWKGNTGETFVLKGTTFERNATRNVWFDSLALTCCGGRPLFNVSAFGEFKIGTMAVHIDGKLVEVTDINDVMNSTSVRHPSTRFSLHQYGDKRIGDKHAQELEVHSYNHHFSVYSSGAGKFESKGEQSRWRHLNMHFPEGLPKGAKGIFAEIVASRTTGDTAKTKGDSEAGSEDEAAHAEATHAEAAQSAGKVGRKSKAAAGKGALQASE